MSVFQELDRLKSQLLSSGIQEKNQPLYQVINQLIGLVRKGFDEINSIINDSNGPNPSSPVPENNLIIGTNRLEQLEEKNEFTIIQQLTPISINRQTIIGNQIALLNTLENEKEEFPIIQGLRGPQGIQGLVGPPGINEEYECSELIPPLGNGFFPHFGFYITPTFNAGNFTGSGSMTWTVQSTDIITEKYTIIGKTLILFLSIENSSVGGTLSFSLIYTLPNGLTISGNIVLYGPRISDNGTNNLGLLQAGGNQIFIIKQSGANYLASTNNTAVQLTLVAEIG